VVGPLVARLVEERWPDAGGYEVLGEKVGCHPDTVEGIIKQHNPGVDFDLADKLLAALGRPDLCPYPESFWQTCDSPLCSRRFREWRRWDRAKRYCSKRCAVQAWKIAHGVLTGNRLRNRCFRGHEFTPENTIVRPNGSRLCRTCRNARRRERMCDPIYRARQKGYERRCRAKAAA
jgi:hypothetical protein